MAEKLKGWCVFCRRMVALDPHASAKLGRDVCRDCVRDL